MTHHENQQNNLYAQRRPRYASASAQYGQSELACRTQFLEDLPDRGGGGGGGGGDALVHIG